MRSSFRPWTAAEEGHFAIGGVPLTKAELERGVPTVTSTAEEVREGSSLTGPQTPDSTAEPRACARESMIPLAGTALTAVTQRVRKAGEAASRIGPLLDKPGTLLHSQPPTFRQARDRHHECADHFGAPVLRGLRLLWGYFHLLAVKPALNLAEWLTESPLRCFLTGILIAAIWIWS